jgi:hypothetical protein
MLVLEIFTEIDDVETKVISGMPPMLVVDCDT